MEVGKEKVLLARNVRATPTTMAASRRFHYRLRFHRFHYASPSARKARTLLVSTALSARKKKRPSLRVPAGDTPVSPLLPPIHLSCASTVEQEWHSSWSEEE